MEKLESIEEAMESKLPKEKPKSLALRRNLERLQLELRNVIQGVKKNNGSCGLPRYGVGEELLYQTEANGSESCTDEVAAIEVKFSSRSEPVPEPLLTPFIVNESAINYSCIHPGEDFSSKATDISKSKGIEELVELQQAHQEENRMNFDSLSLGLDEKEKKIQPDDD
ncbi:hypothetical protein V8G54_006087 [Vigna mungo]|uniref:Uncharacterized protein n=1 Tax=Vigna mungo TaxID=3915 RepID=A0AAQ3NZA9_VIGMU